MYTYERQVSEPIEMVEESGQSDISFIIQVAEQLSQSR